MTTLEELEKRVERLELSLSLMVTRADFDRSEARMLEATGNVHGAVVLQSKLIDAGFDKIGERLGNIEARLDTRRELYDR